MQATDKGPSKSESALSWPGQRKWPLLKMENSSAKYDPQPNLRRSYCKFSMFHFSQYRIFVGLCLALLLSACGGSAGFPPKVTAIKAQTLQYGRTATLLLGGRDMRLSMVVDTGGKCTNPSFASNSSTELMTFNCTVTAVGEMPVTVKDAEGHVLHSTTLTVPKPQVALATSKGSITIELDPVAAPITVNNFLSYVNSGFYKSTLFHRVIAGFVVQGGGYTTGMVKKEGQLDPIKLESNNGLLNLRGTVAMARTNVADSATSEFFVNLVDNATLNYQGVNSPGYAVFGTVVEGMDVIDAIAAVPTATTNGFDDVPTSDVTITLALQVK